MSAPSAFFHGLSIEAASAYTGVSVRTLRRYRLRGELPQLVALALQRRNWIAPESAQYLEAIAYWRGVEANKSLLGESPRVTGQVLEFGSARSKLVAV